MELKSLYLRQFRNYKEALVEFSSGINHIYGQNAQGKTNLLEAIYFLMTGRSFRTHHLKDLIFQGTKEFYLEAFFQKNGVEQTLKMTCDGQHRKIWHNHTLISSLSSLLGLFLGVMLSPEDSDLIKGQPALRRHFLDLHIAQGHPLFVYHLTRYHRAMKQRNVLLRTKKHESIESWEQEMAHSGAYIVFQRNLAAQELEKHGKPLQAWISHSHDHLKLSYKHPCGSSSQAELKDYYLMQFQKQRSKEFEIGTSLVGPHKDDLSIYLDGNEARYFASEGQQRSLIASLRLAQWLHLKHLTEEMPIMCIDDLGISLDKEREEQLYLQLKTLGQVFVTSPKCKPQSDSDSSIRNIYVESGKFLR